jgi:hypothetical protein
MGSFKELLEHVEPPLRLLEWASGSTVRERLMLCSTEQIERDSSVTEAGHHITHWATEDLKLGKFQAADKGQMELYLRWLEKHDVVAGEEPPIGLILCEDKGEEQVELLQLHASGIRVATYFTELPAKSLLERKLKTVADIARRQLEAKPTE